MTFSAMESGPSRPSSGIASSPQRVRSRTQSISSDRPSTIGHGLMSPPLSVSPEAAFIAASAASQIVTNDHDSHADTWYDQHGIEPSGETALVSNAALTLLNSFLDQLLFNFLSVSRSTTLTSLRPAVSEVLKPKLAKDAINQADEELREYLGGGDDEDMLQPQSTESPRDWDLELVWKRTRLRCMVYSSLGDMEEEDEDYHMEQEHLEGGDDQLGETVSPAVAIFLTSILEFMGEQALIVAGQAAYHKMRTKYEKELKEGVRSPVDVADRIIVGDLDMERVALDRTLGRLWRAWKKRIRSPGLDQHLSQRPYSRDSMRPMQGHHARQGSLGAEIPVPEAVNEKVAESAAGDATEVEELEEEYLRAAAIPLPMGQEDVIEILIPGIAYYSDDEEATEEPADKEKSLRPKSLMIVPHTALADLPTPTTSQPQTPVLPAPRKRANSLPTPSASPYTSPPAKRAKIESGSAEGPEEAEADSLSDDFDEETEKSEDEPVQGLSVATRRPVGRPSPVVAEAATAAAAAAQTEQDGSDESDEIDEFAEEPEILTSSRVSISGRSSSPAASVRSRLSINPHLPARSPSLHSPRVIDLAGHRSPVTSTRSQASSADGHDHLPLRTGSSSRASSILASPIAEERRKQGEPSPALRSPITTKPPRGYTGDAIAEAEETAADTPTTESMSTPTSEPSSATRFEELQSRLRTSQPIFGSVVRHASPPQSPVQPMTKVTILTSSMSSGTFAADEKPGLPPKSPVQAKAPSPVLPDRSASRQVSGNVSPTSHPSTIGVITVNRPSTRREDPPEPIPRSSPARSREQPPSVRQNHTSGSSSSSSTKYKPMRASEESTSIRPEDVARNFEELIQSDQTIQYTLTPESMRDIDSRSVDDGSPILPPKGRKSEDARQTGERSRASSVNKPSDLKRSTSISRSTGLSSHPVDSQPNSKLAGPALPSKPRAPNPQAREARVPRESLADFAQFIRATGPPGEAAEVPPVSRGSTAVRSLAGPVPTSKGSMESGRMSTTSARQRYLAREAAVDYKDDNSDLIDFIRRGPPSSTNNPRIPRTVAPFRTTMDSDQLSGAVGGRAVDATLPDIRNSAASTSVTESSMNSSSALLKKDKLSPTGRGNMFDDADMMPKRKTRRVRDPYALDFSDEDEGTAVEQFQRRPKRAPAQKEESLVDFLNSVPPPAETSPVLFDIPQTQSRVQPKKKASAPSLMARFSRSNSGAATKASSSSPLAAGSSPVGSRGGGGRGYIPIQVNMPPGLDKYNPGLPSNSLGASSGPNRSNGRVAMKKFEPRDAQPTISRATSDLADFFRNSEPPPGVSYGPTSPTQEDPSALPKMFARRKRSALA